MGLLLLTLTICGLVLHSWFFIEIQFNGIAFKELAFVNSDKIFDPMKNVFFNELKHFILYHTLT